VRGVGAAGYRESFARSIWKMRLLHNVVVDGAVEGWSPIAWAVSDLAEFVSGRIGFGMCGARALARTRRRDQHRDPRNGCR
jgi:hypothetical protein